MRYTRRKAKSNLRRRSYRFRTGVRCGGTTRKPTRKKHVWAFLSTNQQVKRLLGHDKVAAAVLLPAGFVALHAEGLFFAVADSADAVGADAQRNHVLLDGSGATVAERKVVFSGTALIAVAFDDDLDLRMIAQKIGGLAESGAGIGANVRLIQIEISVLHFLQEHLFQSTGIRGRRRFGWRLRDGDAHGRIRRAARATGGHGVSDGVRRCHFGGTFWSDGADIWRYRQLRGIGRGPMQSGRVAFIDGSWIGGQRDGGSRGCRCGRGRRSADDRFFAAAGGKNCRSEDNHETNAIQRSGNLSHAKFLLNKMNSRWIVLGAFSSLVMLPLTEPRMKCRITIYIPLCIFLPQPASHLSAATS